MQERKRLFALYERFRGCSSWRTQLGCKLANLRPRRASLRFVSQDPHAFVNQLLESDTFCRDTFLGRIYHPRALSIREMSHTNSLHISVGRDGSLSGHVDRVSPVTGRKRDRCCRYSVRRVMRHNLSGMAEDLVGLLSPTRRRRRLDCATSSIEEIAKELEAGAATSSRSAPRTAGPSAAGR